MGTKPTVIEVLTIGDELLLGLTPNGHLTFIGEQLARRGASIARNIVLPDDASQIERQFKESWRRASVVITTGGLGPTCDDRTREVLAGVLGQELVLDKAAKKAIEARFERMGRPMSPNNLKQAYRPKGAKLLPNAYGTAPGIFFEGDGKLLIMLPGPPTELQPMFVDQVLPLLAKHGLISSKDTYIQLRTCGIGESVLEERLQPLMDRFAEEGVDYAFCAHHGQVDFRIASKNGRPGLDRLQEISREFAASIGPDFVCFGHDSLARVVLDRLRSKERSLAVAESCTGGLLSNCFTDLPGASKVFSGGIVCYSNDTKRQMLDVPFAMLEQHGAVSAEVAIAMATGAAERLTSDYALSITGYAGPDGGTSEDPVGTVYIGLYAPEGVWCRRMTYPGQMRLAVKQRAVTAALDWLRRAMDGKS